MSYGESSFCSTIYPLSETNRLAGLAHPEICVIILYIVLQAKIAWEFLGYQACYFQCFFCNPSNKSGTECKNNMVNSGLVLLFQCQVPLNQIKWAPRVFIDPWLIHWYLFTEGRSLIWARVLIRENMEYPVKIPFQYRPYAQSIWYVEE